MKLYIQCPKIVPVSVGGVSREPVSVGKERGFRHTSKLSVLMDMAGNSLFIKPCQPHFHFVLTMIMFSTP